MFVLQYELQWMLLDCDPSKPERDTCDELPEEPQKVRTFVSVRCAYIQQTVRVLLEGEVGGVCSVVRVLTRTAKQKQEEVPLVEFMYLVFTRMPGESYRRRLRPLLLYLCYVFRAQINSLVG